MRHRSIAAYLKADEEMAQTNKTASWNGQAKNPQPAWLEILSFAVLKTGSPLTAQSRETARARDPGFGRQNDGSLYPNKMP